MLKDKLTKDDVGKWYQTVTGKDVLVSCSNESGTFAIMWLDYFNKVQVHIVKPDGTGWKHHQLDFLNLSRKLDDLEVELRIFNGNYSQLIKYYSIVQGR